MVCVWQSCCADDTNSTNPSIYCLFTVGRHLHILCRLNGLATDEGAYYYYYPHRWLRWGFERLTDFTRVQRQTEYRCSLRNYSSKYAVSGSLSGVENKGTAMISLYKWCSIFVRNKGHVVPLPERAAQKETGQSSSYLPLLMQGRHLEVEGEIVPGATEMGGKWWEGKRE